MKHEAVHFDVRLSHILRTVLHPSSTPSGARTSPPNVPNEAVRTHELLKPIQWARHVYKLTAETCLKTGTGDALEQLSVYPNMMFVAEVKWSIRGPLGRVLDEVHCQALITNGATLQDVVVNEKTIPDGQVTYLRADFEPSNLGVVFPDPVPHVHARNKGEPRFPISLTPAAPHVDFIELLLRNYRRPVWNAWADEVWRRRVAPGLPGPVRATDPLPLIRAAFLDGKYEALSSSFREPVLQWKEALQKEKVRMSPLVRDDGCDCISY